MPLANAIAPHLPFLRRYARALTGSQIHGDHFVRAVLEAIVEDPGSFPSDMSPRVGLYRWFHAIWVTANVDVEDLNDEYHARGEWAVMKKLAKITPLHRQLLLLTTMEGFTNQDAAIVTGVDRDEVARLVQSALAEIGELTVTRVLIIEDEPIISADLEAIAVELGHEVVGVAVTREEAVRLADEMRPGLVLADIQLADGSSGIDAVSEILSQFTVPAIFITAYPERLLSGERPEPTYLITKPFLRSTVKATIGQALLLHDSTVEANLLA